MKGELHTNDVKNRIEPTPSPAHDNTGVAGAPTPVVPPDPTRDAAQKRPSRTKTIVAFGLGCLTVNVIVLVLVLGSITAGLVSCMSSCSDNPLADSREDAAFIADLSANDRDLEAFDALRGALDALHEAAVRRGMEEGSALTATDDLRRAIEAGHWPKDEGNALNPRVWVRIAELSQTWLEGQTGESWCVEDFSYPFPDNGPIPVPAVRDEDSACLTRLRCTEGSDEGLYVTVQYYRWAKEAYFEAEQLDEARASAAERKELYERILETGLIGERPCLLSDDDLYVWSTGPDDELRDPQAFLDTANELAGLLGNYGYVTLLEPDTPVYVAYDPLSYNYPNERPSEELSLDVARDMLLRAGYVQRFDHAAGDVLLRGCQQTEGEPIVLEDLTGTLAPAGQEFVRHVWRGPSEESTFDEALVEVAAQTLDIDAKQLIVTSEFTHDNTYDDSLVVWLAAPGGTLPETPEGFCTAMDALRDALWEELPPGGDETRRTLYVHVFELDDEHLVDAEGETYSFAELRSLAKQEPARIDAFTPKLLLSYMIYASQWPEDDEPNFTDCEPSEVDGSIARSRAWRYGAEGTSNSE